MLRYRAGLLVLLVVLAGCGGPSATGTPTPTDVATATGSPKVTGADESFAPGVTTRGITDAEALLSAHRERLLAEGVRLSLVVRSEAGNGTVYQESTQTAEIGPDATAVSVNGSGVGPEGELRTDSWLNETGSLFRFRSDGDTDYRTLDAIPARRGLVLAGNIGLYLTAAPGAFTVESIEEQEGRQVATLVASADLVNGTPGSDTEMRVVVDSDGVIRSFTLDQTQTDGERYHLEYEVLETGVTPERPDWVNAVPAGVFLDLDLGIDVENGSAIGVENGGPDTVPAGSSVTVIAGGVTYEASLSEGIPAGERLWIWIDSDTGELAVGSEKPDADTARSLGGRAVVVIRSDDGIRLASADLVWREGR